MHAFYKIENFFFVNEFALIEKNVESYEVTLSKKYIITKKKNILYLIHYEY